MLSGYIDICMQSHCAGWAVEDGLPASLSIFVNDMKAGDVSCDVDRPDLANHGLPRASGFSFAFSKPLRAGDVVDVRTRTGASIQNSPTSQHSERLERLVHGIKPAMMGLELGPLDRPTLGKADYNVSYVDHASRQDLVRKYQQTGSLATVRPDSIVDVDFVWSGRLRDVVGGGYEYCLASHVIEHVADPIGWLGQIAEVLLPGGRVNLAIPERSRTFDHRRTPSTPAAMLEAFVRKLQRPSFAQIFDHISGVCPIGGPEPDKPAVIRNAYNVAALVESNGEYVDVHCHVWTPESFLECWSVIDTLDLLPLSLEYQHPPFSSWNEFIVSFLRK